MQMPIMDGFETAIRLRECGYCGPIIALTADAMESEMRRCIDCGCDDYLSKPINFGILIEKILMTLNQKMA
jgi:two-component system CheB/CheR fusion protein